MQAHSKKVICMKSVFVLVGGRWIGGEGLRIGVPCKDPLSFWVIFRSLLRKVVFRGSLVIR